MIKEAGVKAILSAELTKVAGLPNRLKGPLADHVERARSGDAQARRDLARIAAHRSGRRAGRELSISRGMQRTMDALSAHRPKKPSKSRSVPQAWEAAKGLTLQYRDDAAESVGRGMRYREISRGKKRYRAHLAKTTGPRAAAGGGGASGGERGPSAPSQSRGGLSGKAKLGIGAGALAALGAAGYAAHRARKRRGSWQDDLKEKQEA